MWKMRIRSLRSANIVVHLHWEILNLWYKNGSKHGRDPKEFEKDD